MLVSVPLRAYRGPMCSTTLMEASPSDELPRPPHFLLNNNNITKVGAMSPASPDDSAASDDRVAPCSPCSPGPSPRSPARGEDDDDEISVGCPSPSPHAGRDAADERMSDDEDYRRHYRSGSSSPLRQEDDYFKPLKKLKMMQINKQARKLRRQSASPPTLSLPTPIPIPTPPAPLFESETTATEGTSPSGVKSFSIMDILNHRPRPAHSPGAVPALTVPPLHRVDAAHAAHAVGLMLQSPAMLAAAASAAASRIVRPWDFGGMLDPAIMMERLHQQQQTLRRHQQHVQQQHLHLQQQAAAHHQAQHAAHAAHAAHAQQHALSLSRPQSADLSSSACSSGRSSTASDCCSPSPDVRRQQQQQGKDGNSPLDALFQMTSKTFDGLNGEQSAEGSGSHLNLFNSRQQPKKKRKSRTAFTNHQIFELEKRFLYQKYLSPADRDEIAAGLGLSNAQVITWFQNRRAKLKRDMEELKKDVESAKVLTAHKSFLEKVHSLGVLKKKAPPQEKSPVSEK